jgi:hypothetical protein
MTPLQFIAEVRKYMQLTGATSKEIRKVTGWSASTMQRKFRNPDSINLLEAHEIKNFLGMNIAGY